MARLDRRPGVRYPVLVPNERGLARAESAGVDAVCVFTAASEAFTAHNINMTIAESIDAFRPVVDARARAGMVDARLREHRLRLSRTRERSTRARSWTSRSGSSSSASTS